MFQKRIPLLALAAVLFIIFIFYSSSSARDTWRELPQHIGMGERLQGGNAPNSQTDPDYVNWNPKPAFTRGSPMPAGHNYTSKLVIAKIKKEDVGWMDEEMPDQEKMVYVADDPTAPYHPPKNKGHEVMVYLSYIIDNYDNLPDVSIFMHAHKV